MNKARLKRWTSTRSVIEAFKTETAVKMNRPLRVDGNFNHHQSHIKKQMLAEGEALI